MFKILNRPISPHLSVYISQFTSVYSIWHRFTGLILASILVIVLFFCKISSYSILNHNFINYDLEISLWIKNSIFLNIVLIFLYHTINGIRHIFWDLGFNLIIKFIKNTAIIISMVIIVTIFFFHYKIL
nr:succinate:cytochrome c oxidoreductase subunit 3 [Synarthrophyton patena]